MIGGSKVRNQLLPFSTLLGANLRWTTTTYLSDDGFQFLTLLLIVTLHVGTGAQDVLLQVQPLQPATLGAVGALQGAVRTAGLVLGLLGQTDQLRAAAGVGDELVVARAEPLDPVLAVHQNVVQL